MRSRPLPMVFIDPDDKAYLSITGRASVLRDVEKTKAVWRKADEVWWPDGPDSPDVSLLRIEPITAELWDGPASAAVAALVRQGEADRAGAEARPESQDHPPDVSERPIAARHHELYVSLTTISLLTICIAEDKLAYESSPWTTVPQISASCCTTSPV